MPTTETTRWNLVVPTELDQSLRQYLANEGRSKKGELSRFVEEAVSKYIFESAARAAKKHNEYLDPAELDAMIEESLAWARVQRR